MPIQDTASSAAHINTYFFHSALLALLTVRADTSKLYLSGLRLTYQSDFTTADEQSKCEPFVRPSGER